MGKVNFNKNQSENGYAKEDSLKSHKLTTESAPKKRKKLNKRCRSLKKKLSMKTDKQYKTKILEKKQTLSSTVTNDNQSISSKKTDSKTIQKKIDSKPIQKKIHFKNKENEKISIKQSTKSPIIETSMKSSIIETSMKSPIIETSTKSILKKPIKKERNKNAKRDYYKKIATNDDVLSGLGISSATISSNWESLKKTLNVQNGGKISQAKKMKQNKKSKEIESNSSKNKIWFDDVDPILLEADPSEINVDNEDNENKNTIEVIGLDCEMVGGGYQGEDDILARVSIVNQHGNVLYDKYIKPSELVVDYRTKVSGIRASDLVNGTKFEIVQKEVDCLMKDKILIGHALKNDLHCLLLTHPRSHTRDTSKYKPLQKLVGKGCPSLKKLSEVVLATNIQDGEHSSVEDARAAMQIYLLHRKDWESSAKVNNSRRENMNRKLKKKKQITMDES